MAKKTQGSDLTGDELLKVKKRGYAVTRSYDYDNHYYDEDAEELRPKPPEEFLTEDEWRALILKEWSAFAGKCEYAFFIFHDKDVLADGSAKPLHVHGVFKFKNAVQTGTVYNELGLSRIENCQAIKSYSSVCRYLLHITDDAIKKGKHIYGQDELHCFYSKGFKKTYNDLIVKNGESDKDEMQTIAMQTHAKIRKGELRTENVERYLASQIDDEVELEKLYQTHRRAFAQDSIDYGKIKAKDMKRSGRSLRTFYVQGPGGIGKTKLARALASHYADGQSYHAVAMGGRDKTFDFTSCYDNENVTVMDEVTGSMFDNREFLSIFDPHNYSPVNSRNADRDWLAEYCLITNSVPLTEFVTNNIIFSKGGSAHGDAVVMPARLYTDDATCDVYYQTMRRFSVNIELIPQNENVRIRIWTFSTERRGFVYKGSIVAPRDFYVSYGPDDNIMSNVVKRVAAVIDSDNLVMLDGRVLKDKHLRQNVQQQLELSTVEQFEGFGKMHFRGAWVNNAHLMHRGWQVDSFGPPGERKEKDVYVIPHDFKKEVAFDGVVPEVFKNVSV